jgi:type IV pilus assembly protein PilA
MTNRKGFTLIELLIVVVIIGILAAIAIPKFANTKEKAVLASMKSDLRNIVTAQEGFFSDNQTYSTTLGAAQVNTAAPGGACAGTFAFQPSSGNAVVVGSCTAAGWNAVATNTSLKGAIATCGIYVGSGAPPNAAVVTEGAPACY